MLFLRIHTRRGVKPATPSIAHGDAREGVLVLQMQQLLMLSRAPNYPATAMRRWLEMGPVDGGEEEQGEDAVTEQHLAKLKECEAGEESSGVEG